MRPRLAVFVVVLGAILAPAALAVWGGQLDTAHPQVGAVYFDFEGEGEPVLEGQFCSGSYVGESRTGLNDVFLLAGHCLPPAEEGIAPGDLYVSFASNAASTSPADPVANPIQVSSYHQMPGFGHDAGDFRDLGVLLLPKDSVPSSITPLQLSPAGYLDRLKQSGQLNFRTVDLVGYGVIPDWDSRGPTSFSFDAKRRSGTSTVAGLTKSLLRLNQNRNGIGTGSGACFGDSGSPQLDRGTLRILSVTSGGNGQCNSVNVNYRVDTPQARAFLGQFLNLP